MICCWKARTLQEKIKAADLAAAKSDKSLTPEQQEVIEENQGANNNGDGQPNPATRFSVSSARFPTRTAMPPVPLRSRRRGTTRSGWPGPRVLNWDRFD